MKKALMITLSVMSLQICSNPLQTTLRKAADKGSRTFQWATKTKTRTFLSAYAGLSTTCISHEVIRTRAAREEISKTEALWKTAKDIAIGVPFLTAQTICLFATAPYWAAQGAIEHNNRLK